MSKADPASSKKERAKAIRWVVTIFFVTITVSALISFASEEIMEISPIYVAFLILLAIVFLGIIFDVVGVAVTSADEKPFHSMAARKVPGAQEAIRLLRNAGKVGSICNDVIGDICGVVSGSASATIAMQLLNNFGERPWTEIVIPLVLSALVAGITVAGKAVGKNIAIDSSTGIVHFVGRIIYGIRHIASFFRGGKAKAEK